MGQKDQLNYSDVWSEGLGPPVGIILAPTPDANGMVFNYTYVLPTFCRAIYVFIGVINAFKASELLLYKTVAQGGLESCIARLTTVHDTILNQGLQSLRVPTEGEVWNHPPDSEGSYWTTQTPSGWKLHGSEWFNGSYFKLTGEATYGPVSQPYGAVDIFSGCSSVGSYPLLNPPSLYPPPAGWYLGVFSILSLRILKRKKDVYVQVGMPAVRGIINQLKSLVGDSPLPGSHFEDWSLGEAFRALGYPQNPQFLPPPPLGVGHPNEPVQQPEPMSVSLLSWYIGTYSATQFSEPPPYSLRKLLSA